MVTRKPVGPPITTSNAAPSPAPKANPPYPTTPVLESAKSTASSNSVYSPDLNTSPAFDLVDINTAKQRARSDSDDSSHGTWNSDDTMDQDHERDTTEDYVEVPKPLQVRSSQQDMNGKGKAVQGGDDRDTLPSILRIGGEQGARPAMTSPGHGYDEEARANPWAGGNSNRSSASAQLDSNNPYHSHNGFVADGSQSVWQEVKPPPIPSAAPPPLPSAAPPPPPNTSSAPIELSAVKSPTEELSEMSLYGERPASWETAEIIPVPQKGMAPFSPVVTPSIQNAQRPSSTWWQDSSNSEGGSHQAGASASAAPYPIEEDPSESLYAPPPGPPPSQQSKLIDHDEASATRPPKPAPISTSQPNPTPSSGAVPETPGTMLKRQRNEHYQIKHINWYDTSDPRAKSTLRRSPILTQNANGPCPLLALVNALVLSTPQHHDTALVEVLRSREQVSLGLLLDAVFDELMSGRRGETAHALPDVSELYAFLLALHTGMNVNPRFVTPVSTPRGSLDGHPNALTSVHPMHRAQRKAGVFEETREMRLYSTFNIPLIHGWTAPADSPAYEAFVRSAPTFEDAQNIQFAEAELEDKLRSEGLTPQEQQTLTDIQTIKAFLGTWPTQLTDFGLRTIAESLNAGQFAILFRNDHFSTIYKEPTYGALMTLITDTGYSSHDEIVWESLVDVTGSASEMFSGDFRAVSHNQDVRLNQGNTGGGQEGWHTVPPRKQNRTSGGPASPSSNANVAPPLPGPRPNNIPTSSQPIIDEALGVSDSTVQRTASEQEDHDLALALQLQEEEEANQRDAESRRRREQELSEQFLSNESEGPRPPVPPRRNGGRTGTGPTTGANTTTPTARPAVNRPTDALDSDAPPSYDQAWSDRPYRPAGSTAPADLAQGNPLGAYDALRRQNAGPNAPVSPVQNRRRSDVRYGRRQSQMGGPPMPGAYVQNSPNPQRVSHAPNVKDADDRCVVM